MQDNVKTQLRKVEEGANSIHKKLFADCTQAQRELLLLNLSTSEKKEEKYFFNIVKSETIRGFNTSQKVMQEYLGYQIAPGHYYGCIDVKA